MSPYRSRLAVDRRPGSLLGAPEPQPCAVCGCFPRSGRYEDDYCRCAADAELVMERMAWAAFWTAVKSEASDALSA